MAKQSAGLLLYKTTNKGLEVLLVHPGGPFWAKKDKGSWSIPKGEFAEDEKPLVAARREFAEELGVAAPEGDLLELGTAKQSSGKVVHAWAIKTDLDIRTIRSNMFDMEWPPKSGKMEQFPEVDRADWFLLDAALQKVVKGQVPLLERLAEQLGHVVMEPPADPQTSLF